MSPSSEKIQEQAIIPMADAGASYGHGWRVMWKYFLELLLIVFISFLLSIPTMGLSFVEECGWPMTFPLFLFSLAYTILFLWPVEYGVSFAFLKAARGERPEAKDIFDVFQNWGNALLAHLLSAIIIGIGMFFFVVPGIIFACKLAFVPYLVVDRKMEAIEAMHESWRMTTGHAANVFLIVFISIFIAIAGLICFFVGVIVAGIWIKLAFASLYYAVAAREGKAATKA